MAGLVPTDDLPDTLRGTAVPADDLPSAAPAVQASTPRQTRVQALKEGYQKQYGIENNLFGAISEPVTTLVTGGAGMVVGGLAGIAQGAKNLVSPGMPAAERVEQVSGTLTYEPRTRAGQATTAAAGKVLGYPFRKYGELTDLAGGSAAEASGSPAAGAALKTGLDFVPALLTRGKVGRGNRGPNRTGAPAEAGEAAPRAAAPAKAERQAGLASVREKPPAIDELRAQAQAAYKRAEDAGISIPANSVTGLKARIVADLKKDGLNPTLHPDATAALKQITGAKGDLTLSELETLRRVASDAQKSIKPADSRLAGKIIDHIDDLVEDLPGDAAALKEARGLYSRMKKAEDIENLIERANTKSANFSGSGLENALRSEFKALSLNKSKMRRFTPEERAAIKKVATGGGKLSPENLTRYIGKLAPTGGLSTYLGLGAAAMIPGGIAVPAIGGVGRIAATQLTKRNANRASELMRRGPIPGNSLIPKRKNALTTADQ